MSDEPMDTENLELRVQVKVIKTKGESALIEWGDPTGRAFVPVSEIEDGYVKGDILAECPPYGIEWEEYLIRSSLSESTIETVAQALRTAGIWTFEDLQAKDRVVTRIAVNIIGTAVWNAAKRATAKGAKKGE